MTTPIIAWYQLDNTTQFTNFEIGTVDAGSISPDTTVLIWNNKTGATDVSDMTNCTITTKDNSGGNTGDVVANAWIQARVDSMDETTFSPIGGTTTKVIQAATSGAGIIKGTVNDGSLTADSNFAKVTLHANIPQNATAGNFDFLTRVSYQYV